MEREERETGLPVLSAAPKRARKHLPDDDEEELNEDGTEPDDDDYDEEEGDVRDSRK
jgi:hypothetical protein